MDIHKPKLWHGWREFLKEYGIIVLGVVTALAFEQAAEVLRWAHETGDAREVLGREIAYDVKALDLIGMQDKCISQHLDALQKWADGTGPRPAGKLRRPIFYTMQTSTWDVANSGQVVVHFPLDEKLRFAGLYASLVNERETIAEERDAWQTIVAIAGDQSTLDDEDRRDLRHAVGLARTIGPRRRGNAGVLLRVARSLSVDAPGPSYGPGTPSDPGGFCRAQ
jgi:hypothetical protein